MLHYVMTFLSRTCGKLSRKFRRTKSLSVVRLPLNLSTQRSGEQRTLSRKTYAARAWLSASQAATTTSGNNVTPLPVYPGTDIYRPTWDVDQIPTGKPYPRRIE